MTERWLETIEGKGVADYGDGELKEVSYRLQIFEGVIEMRYSDGSRRLATGQKRIDGFVLPVFTVGDMFKLILNDGRFVNVFHTNSDGEIAAGGAISST